MKTNKSLIIILILFTFSLIFFLFNNPTIFMEKERISNSFIDVNGDGMVDFVIDANVIMNVGQSNFPAQPMNNQP